MGRRTGYSADVSDDSDQETDSFTGGKTTSESPSTSTGRPDVDASASPKQPTFLLPPRRSSARRRRRRREEKRQQQLAKRANKGNNEGSSIVAETVLAPSPIHPEIDLSLTHHITAEQLAKVSGQRLSTGMVSSNVPLETLSRMLTDYFASVHRKRSGAPIAIDESDQAAIARGSIKLQKPASLAADVRSKHSNCSSHNTSKSGGKRRSRKRRRRPPIEYLETPVAADGGPHEIAEDKPNKHRKEDAQKVSQASSTKFSKETRTLEDALALTDTPRLLIEAASPYRVVHANLAFSQYVVGTSTNVQRWTERHNPSSKASRKYSTLQKALRDLIPNPDIPLIVFPVLGSEQAIAHFLVETTNEDYEEEDSQTRRGRRRSRKRLRAAQLKAAASDHSLASSSLSSGPKHAQAVG